MPSLLQPVEFPAGLYLNGSEYQRKGRWQTGQMVRWRNKLATPIGGWKKVAMSLAGTPISVLVGALRAMLTYRDNMQSRWMAAGSSQKLYAFDGGTFTDITPAGFTTGNENSSLGLGYGAGIYGAGNYGTVRVGAGIALEPAYWSLDTFGEYLVACANCDGKLYQWPPNTGAATVITNAPTKCRSLIVTNERYLFALGAESPPGTANPRNVAWCDQEDINTWTPTLTNTAGSIILDTPGIIFKGTRFQGDVLIFTDQDIHRSQYLGPPLVYGFKRVGTACGAIGPNAVVQSTDVVAWMSQNGFFYYDGYVKPLPCDVADFVFNDINKDQQQKVCCGLNSTFNEFWWWYPSGVNTECDKYIIWNYVDNWWSTGTLSRSAWADSQVWPNPFASLPIVNGDGTTSAVVYSHEQGYMDDNVTRPVSLYSGPIEIGNGDQLAVIDRVFQDSSGVLGVATVSFGFRNAPNAAETIKGPYMLDDTRGYTDVRAQGRQMTFRIDQVSGQDQYWHIGTFRVSMQAGSRR